MRPFKLCAVVAGAFALAACETPPPGTGTSSASTGTLLTNVEIFDGTTFTATWRNAAPTTVRLAYDAAIVVTDDELGEIVQQLTGCSRVSGAISTEFFGGMVTALVPASC